MGRIVTKVSLTRASKALVRTRFPLDVAQIVRSSHHILIPRCRRLRPPVPSAKRLKAEGHIPHPLNSFILFRQDLNAKAKASGETHQRPCFQLSTPRPHQMYRNYRYRRPQDLVAYQSSAVRQVGLG